MIGLMLSTTASWVSCFNDEAYYSHQHVDFGIEPPPGVKSGSRILVLNNKVLGKQPLRVAEPAKGVWDIEVSIEEGSLIEN